MKYGGIGMEKKESNFFEKCKNLICEKYYQVIWLGTENNDDLEEVKRTIFCNQIALIFLFGISGFGLILWYLQFKALSLSTIIIFLIYLMCLYANSKQKYCVAKCLLFLGAYTSVGGYSYYLGKNLGIHNTVFLLIVLSFALFKKEMKFVRAISIWIPAIMFYIFCLLAPDTTDLADTMNVTESRIIIFTFVSFLIFLIFGVTLKYFEERNDTFKYQFNKLLSIYNLTQTEGEIIVKIIEGKSNSQIAQEQGIEPGTVKNHLSDIYRKTKVKGRLALCILLRHVEQQTKDSENMPSDDEPS